MSWNDERVDLLKKMWGEGQSASQIAKELGGVTRNAVIGKVHRLGLSHRGSGDGALKGGDEQPAETPPIAVEPAPPPEEPVATEPAAAEPSPEPATVVVEAVVVASPVRDITQPRAPGLPTPEEEAARVT